MDTGPIRDAIVAHALTSGRFERVNGHDPDSPPGTGLTVAVWSDYIGPAPSGSGLAATTARVVFMVRIYSSVMQEPQDDIDPNLDAACDALMTAYSADFELGGLVRNVDLLAQTGAAMSAQAGWVTYPNGALYRTKTITLPVIVNDAWPQSP